MFAVCQKRKNGDFAWEADGVDEGMRLETEELISQGPAGSAPIGPLKKAPKTVWEPIPRNAAKTSAHVRTPQNQAFKRHMMTASDWKPAAYVTTISRASGALLGQCVGDALGCRYQYRSGADVRRQIDADRENHSGFLPIRGSTVFDFPPGQVGDGTELCMLVARSISREGGVSIPDVLSSLIKWKRSNPVDMDATVLNALELGSEDENLNFTADELEQNVIKNAFRQNMTSLSNVCLTVATPLAIAGVNSTDQSCTEIAARIVKLTQPHPGAVDAVRVLTTAIRSLLICPDPQMAYKRAFECAKTHLIREHMLQSRSRPHPQPEDETTLSDEELPIEYLGIALQSAFYYLLHARTFAEGVIGCIELGGDTTTNAAITGALLGARFGLMEIPGEWRATVQSAKLERHTRFPDVFLGDADQLVERLLTKVTL
ncbi:hypothetical protein QR680_016572 [Steinernema hermaphroditum]|uniref:ADP-ribosylhydrolase ARH3 n=1 Tax=Steinernema hermaphroditum TaxID=289476 RepID=A0AA39HBN0_9BILA|nr:hypothetical protein QR680_016572 [Steinernema hermaphroditum]